ncbi:thiol-disulfide oxidoreductase DCC family protein [Roseovarius sp. Pro17]|uniref:thiol-disulfide oxidoreductase DCC family protein n=1 Tax=Roseovarius sp. Pro17 TaxID=3108175 RepID=UPI002D7A3015|nr:thiol-disulfide oxidoreductase DCC family protein [Roseovarius sp. Pro17]
MKQNMAIWVFDSQCVLCDGGVQYTLRHEKAASIRFVAIQSSEGRALAKQHGVDPDDPSTFLFIENGVALEKSDAVIALSRHLNGPSRFVPLTKILPKGMRDFAYGIVAKHRYRLFGKMDVCMLPNAANIHRFTL